jgi:hypothetical protein
MIQKAKASRKRTEVDPTNIDIYKYQNFIFYSSAINHDPNKYQNSIFYSSVIKHDNKQFSNLYMILTLKTPFEGGTHYHVRLAKGNIPVPSFLGVKAWPSGSHL